jgi:hypothetical protein
MYDLSRLHRGVPSTRGQHNSLQNAKVKLKKDIQEIIHQTKLVLRLLDLRSFVSKVSDHFSFGSQDRALGRGKRKPGCSIFQRFPVFIIVRL